MPGFPPETVAFLRGLREHNDRDWFADNRQLYLAGYVEPAKAFVEAATEQLRGFVPDIVSEPRVDGSIVRVNRDAPLADGQDPYNEHLDLWLWEGERRQAVSGLFLRITPETVDIGVGAHRFDRRRLTAYRDAVAHPRAGACLVDITKDLARKGYRIEGEHYKRIPQGYDLDGERERLVRFNALWSHAEVEHPSILHTRRFLKWCVHRWGKQLELHRWLVDEVR